MIAIGIPVPVVIFFGGNAVDDQISTVVAIQSTDNIKQGRLSGTGRTEDSNELIISEIQRDIIKRALNQFPCLVFL